MPTAAAPHLAAIQIALPRPLPWPAVACTAVELERLRQAFRGGGPEHEVVARRVQQAEEALLRPVQFPPEGGQHNQLYQCDGCQVALETVADTQHRCRQCGTVYSGYPYDQVIYSRQHGALTRDMEACAWSFALTSDARYAARAREILVGYGERYAADPHHSASLGKRTDPDCGSGAHVVELTLNEAAGMRSGATA